MTILEINPYPGKPLRDGRFALCGRQARDRNVLVRRCAR